MDADTAQLLDELITLYGKALVEIRVLQQIVMEHRLSTPEDLAKRFDLVATAEHERRKNEAQQRLVDRALRNCPLQ